MVFVARDRALLFTNAKGKRVAIPVSGPAVGDRAVNIPISGGRAVAVPISEPLVLDTVIDVPDSRGKQLAVCSNGKVFLAMVGVRNASGDTYRSIDGGATWAYQSTTLPESVAFVYVGAGVAYSAHSSPAEIWKTIDYGITWSLWVSLGGYSYPATFNGLILLSDGNLMLTVSNLPSHYLDIIKINTATGAYTTVGDSPYTSYGNWPGTVIYTADHHLIVAYCTDSSAYGAEVILSLNDGVTWAPVLSISNDPGNGTLGSFCDVGGGVVLLSMYESNVTPLWRSTDGGATWAQIGDAPFQPVEYNGSMFSPSAGVVLKIGQDPATTGFHDVYRSTNSGTSWTKITTEFIPASIYPITCAWGDIGRRVILFYVAGSGYAPHPFGRSIDGGLTWTTIDPGYSMGGWSMLVMPDHPRV